MIRHISGLAEIVQDVPGAVRFYRDQLDLAVDYQDGEPYAVVHVSGVLHFGLWERRFAAQRLFGDESRVSEVPTGFLLGFEVDDPASAIKRIQDPGKPLQPAQEEPWGQQTARFLTPGGALCEFTHTPWARVLDTGPSAVPGNATD